MVYTISVHFELSNGLFEPPRRWFSQGIPKTNHAKSPTLRCAGRVAEPRTAQVVRWINNLSVDGGFLWNEVRLKGHGRTGWGKIQEPTVQAA
jgi:hypothetical protein